LCPNFFQKVFGGVGGEASDGFNYLVLIPWRPTIKRLISKTFAPLFALRGNPRVAVFTEPLWGIPYNLYFPFLTLFMFSLGLEDADIGILLSVGLIVQMTTGVLGGVINDKFGRRRSMLVGDIVSWAVPCLIWALAQDFRWFLVAAVFHGMFPTSANAWESLLVEDAEPDSIVKLFNWVYIAGLLAVFVTPIAGYFIFEFSLVPVMRVILGFSFVSMMAKFIIHFYYATETRQGLIRMKETANVSVLTMLLEYKGVLRQIFTTTATRRVLLLIIALNIQMMVAGSFFSIFVTQDLALPEHHLANFNVLRGAVMLAFFLVFQRLLDMIAMHKVMIAGLVVYIVAYILLIFTPAGLMFPLLIFIVMDACAAAMFLPRRDTMVVNNINPAERARIRGMLMVIMLGAASPFGYLAGLVAGFDRRLLFAGCILLFMVMGAVVLMEVARGKKIEVMG